MQGLGLSWPEPAGLPLGAMAPQSRQLPGITLDPGSGFTEALGPAGLRRYSLWTDNRQEPSGDLST